jgi:SanA protein
MFKRLWTAFWKTLQKVGMVALALLLLPRFVTSVSAWNQVFQTENAPTARVAIIFGAGLRRDGSPTAVLRDRVQTGVDLYFDGKVEKLLMSGDNSTPFYNEPEAMRQYALSLGVPVDDIVLDYAGSRTYDTCYRANAIFGVDNALLVTQSFHLPRALFLCNSLGVDAAGVEADNLNYRRSSLVIWNIREQMATLAAFFDLYVDNPALVLGAPEPIFVD